MRLVLDVLSCRVVLAARRDDRFGESQDRRCLEATTERHLERVHDGANLPSAIETRADRGC